MAARTEQQKYKTVFKEKDFEIRHYPSARMATVFSSARSYRAVSTPGFRRLANFIFGGNERSARISMTAPVHMSIDDERSSMSFVMPEAYFDRELPKPNDSGIVLEKTKDEYVAALRFRGFANDHRLKSYEKKLKDTLDSKSIPYSGKVRYLGYNPPYQIIGRRNELIVSVEWNG